MGLNYLANIGRYIPELIMCMTMMGLILVEVAYDEGEKKKPLLYTTAFIGLIFSLSALVSSFTHGPELIFTRSMVIDPFSAMIKIIMVLGTAGAVYLASVSEDIQGSVKGEFAIIAVGVLIGGMILASANNLLMLYIGIETLSILSYVLASLKKSDDRSSEAGLKYVLYGGVSSAFMLFGMSHLFGILGTINFSDMVSVLGSVSTTQVAILIPSFILFFVGLGYKIACVPFHMWSPDVYEGSPLPVTAFFSIVPKMAGMAALVRVSMVLFGQEGALQDSWIGLLSIAGAMTMTVGNVSALGQRSVKRMLAFSSISHAGMMMMGVVVLNAIGVRAVVFYGVTYLFMTLVAFYIVSFVQDKYGNDHFERFNGLSTRYPMMAIMMIAVMFSLTGIPPLAGFVAKFNILYALVEQKYYALAIIAVLNSVISAYYYLKIVRLMVFKQNESEEKIEGFGFRNQSIILAMTVPVLVLGIFWQKLMVAASGASLFIQ